MNNSVTRLTITLPDCEERGGQAVGDTQEAPVDASGEGAPVSNSFVESPELIEYSRSMIKEIQKSCVSNYRNAIKAIREQFANDNGTEPSRVCAEEEREMRVAISGVPLPQGDAVPKV